MDKWVQSEADAYTLEVKANLKLGNKGALAREIFTFALPTG
jgi:hypothetical protein